MYMKEIDQCKSDYVVGRLVPPAINVFCIGIAFYYVIHIQYIHYTIMYSI